MINYPGKTCAELGITAEALTKLESLRFYDVREVSEFRIYGLYEPRTQNPFIRMPQNVADAVSPSVAGLNGNTAGGCIRFVTDSPYVAIKTTNPSREGGLNMGTTGTSGFDLYVKHGGRDRFRGAFRPPVSYEHGFDAILYLDGGRKEITLNLPTYHSLTDLYIGLDANASLSPRADYTWEKPVLYYGSSITQGGSASRPGMAYEAIISRRLDCNFVNLGFSGSAKGEDAIIDYIASLDVSAFVLDYDHNAPTAAHLEATHEKLYLAFRKTHPETPVIMVTKPDAWDWNREVPARRDVIYRTYSNARQRGENVRFIDGASLFHGEMRDECTVDGCHPNDLGMTRMADVIGKAVEDALGGNK